MVKRPIANLQDQLSRKEILRRKIQQRQRERNDKIRLQKATYARIRY